MLFQMSVWLTVSIGFYAEFLEAEQEYTTDAQPLQHEQNFMLSDYDADEESRASDGKSLLDIFTLFGFRPDSTLPTEPTKTPTMTTPEVSTEKTELTAIAGDVRSSDPFHMAPRAQQVNCTSVGANCERCSYIDWLEIYNKTIDESVTAVKYTNVDEKKCFQRCNATISCVLYTFDKLNRICKIHNELKVMNVRNDTTCSMFLRISPTFIFLSEWIVTRDRVPRGTALTTAKVTNVFQCIVRCANRRECVFASLNRSNNACTTYSKKETQIMDLRGNHISIEHVSLTRDDSLWRFRDVGNVFQRNVSSTAFTTESFEDCLEYCSTKDSCNLATTFSSNDSTVDCYLYDNFENRWFEDVPPTNSKRSFYKAISRNNTNFKKLPNLISVATTTKPIQTKFVTDPNDCHRIAMNSTSCYWYSYNSTANICKLYSFVVQVVKVKSTTQTDLATFSKSIPTTYVPFYGFESIWLPKKIFNNITTSGQSSGLQCLGKCLNLENCSAVAIQMSQQNYCSSYDRSTLAVILDNASQINDVGLQTVQLFMKSGDPRLIQSTEQFRCSKMPIITSDEINQILQFESLDRIRNDISKGNNLLLTPHGSSFDGARKGVTDVAGVRHLKVTSKGVSPSKVTSIFVGSTVTGASVGSGIPVVGTFIGGVIGAGVGLTGIGTCLITNNCNEEEDDSCEKRCSWRPSDMFLKSISTKFVGCTCGKLDIRKRGHYLDHVKDPDDQVEGPYQEDCTGKSVGDRCKICCRVGFESEKDPTCVCDKKGTSWDPKPARCVRSTKCYKGQQNINGVDMWGLRVADCKDYLYYGLFFNDVSRLPFFTVYHFTKINEIASAATGSWVSLQCSEITTKQYSTSDYKLLKGFDKGHLTPNGDVRFRLDAVRSTHVYANAAPQDWYSNRVPWKTIEGRIRSLLSEEVEADVIRTGYVMTGVCLSNGPVKGVPRCFWKMVCTRTDDGAVTVAGFYHENILTVTDQDKTNRDNEVYQLRDMRNMSELNIGYSDLKELWALSAAAFWEDSPSSYIHQCENSDFIPLPISVNHRARAPKDYTLYNFWNEKIFGKGFNETSSDTNTEPDDFGLSGSGSPPSCGAKIVGYVTGWSDVKFTLSASSYLSHVIFAFIQMKSDGTLVVGSADPENTKDVNIDIKKSYLRLYEIKAAKEKSGNRLHTIFAVGGWENSQFFPATAANGQLTQNFIRTAIEILDYFNMDGIDVDWEYPVGGGAHEGSKQDRENYVSFLKSIRNALASHQRSMGRSEPYSLTIAGAAGSWVLDDGFDLPAIADIVDWINVMAYDYNGAWDSKWGAYTGPHAPLYFGAPEGYSGKTNVDYTMKYYSCRIQNPKKLVMGLGFYGRFWNNTGKPVGKDPVWRIANQNAAGKFDGGSEPWRIIDKNYLTNPSFQKHFNEKTQTPYLDDSSGFLMGYENTRSIHEKVKYASAKGFAGVMIWAVDLDDPKNTLLRTASSESLCSGASDGVSREYKCPPIQEQRWWTLLDDQDKAGMCGKSAPLYKGYYPVCDPEDPGYACCSTSGYCGSGDKFCKCDGCVDYYENPEKILDEPIKPSTPVRWHTMDKFQSGPQCGYLGHKLENGKFAICNPDNVNGYCCSAAGYCGKKSESCDCEGCVNFRKNPNFEYPEKTWIDSGPDAGKCGKNAKVNGRPATCNPLSKDYYCCSLSGYCGSGSEYCDCNGCINYKNK